MNVLIFSLIVAALILGPLGIIIFLINLIKHKSKKVPLVLVSLSIAFIVFSVALVFITEPEGGYPEIGVNTPTYSSDTATTQNSNAMTDADVFAAKFCMAYMKHLKNPYSFQARSIWINDLGYGYYEIFVKYTAQNDFGADVANQVGSSQTLTYSNIDEIASSRTFLDVRTKNEPPATLSSGRGTYLDSNKIQNYINSNYH